MTWEPMPQPVLRQVLLWETGVMALSVVSVLLASFVAHIQGVGQLWRRFPVCHLTALVGQPLGEEALAAMVWGVWEGCKVPIREQIPIIKHIFSTSVSLHVQQLLQPPPPCQTPQRGLRIQQHHEHLA